MEQAEERSNDLLVMRLQELEKENAMLKRILDQHGISYSVSVESSTIEQPTHIVTDHTIRLSLQEKVAIFQNLFKGRDDVFAKRWYSPSSQKAGYQPVCAPLSPARRFLPDSATILSQMPPRLLLLRL